MTTYPIETFEIVSGEFKREHFQKNPLWSEHYDFDERDEIESWGVDRAWLDSELARLPDYPHPVYPVLVHRPWPERMRLFISAEFRTPVGNKLDGYLVNSPPDAVGIFLLDDGEVLNCHPVLRDELAASLNRIRGVLADDADPILPLRYVSSVKGPYGVPIQGEFGPHRSRGEAPTKRSEPGSD